MRSETQRARDMRLSERIARARQVWEHGATSVALQEYDDVLAELELYPSDALLAEALRGKGTVLRETGETEAAHSCYVRSAEAAQRSQLPGAHAHALNCLAIVAQRRGDLRETTRLYDNAARLAAEAEDHRLLGMIEQNRGVLASIRGEAETAEALYTKSFDAFKLAGDTQAMSWILNNLGMLLTRTGKFRGARSALERGLRLAIERNDAVVSSVIRLNLAELWLAAGETKKAHAACSRALDDARSRNDHLTMAEALACRAKIERRLGDFESGIATLRIARYEAAGTEDRLLLAEILRELGELEHARGSPSEARQAWKDAVETFRTAGALTDADSLQQRLIQLHRN
jgi:tetratricopeptide (TPR) repeat protein